MAQLPAPQVGVITGAGGGAQAPSGLTTNGAGTSGIYVSSDGGKPTYRTGLVGATLYSTAAAVILEIQGSATKTVRVKRISIWAQAATKFFTELGLYRATTVAGGTPVPAVASKHDSSDPAATAVVNSYAGASVLGTTPLIFGATGLYCGPPAAGNGLGIGGWDFCHSEDKALILRGTSEWIAVYNTITGLGTGTFGFEVEWEEDNS